MTWRAPDTSPEVWERDHGTDGHATDYPNPKVYAMRAGTEVHALRLTPATGPAVMAWVREHGAQCLLLATGSSSSAEEAARFMPTRATGSCTPRADS